jgi:hypothetical protein
MVAFFLFVCSTCFAGSYRGPPGRLPSGGAPTAPAATEPPPLRGTPRRHLPDERPGTSAACNRRLPRDAVAGDRATAAAAAGRPSRGRPDDAPGYRRAGRGGHAGSALAARPPCRRAWSARWVLELGAATPRMGLGMNVVAAAPALPIAVEGDSVGSPWCAAGQGAGCRLTGCRTSANGRLLKRWRGRQPRTAATAAPAVAFVSRVSPSSPAAGP